ncbi:UDP-4-amino-4,6-dideoxy-N-acetyl-beta-L-altrosamine transaminase [Colwellia sp. 39_35_sub15_T18]|nr:UDP-4-amino-4,6-dideoxy-N-acetyl-beta-L-altrosamine transaminase [Colwellia sp. 39_35_sub15_T18]
MILYGKQNISAKDIAAVTEILASSHLTQGNAGLNFEHNLAQQCQAKHAKTFCNATSALHSACLALELGTDDIAWTSPISFVASANCAIYCGANIDFVDVELQTGNISIVALTKKLVEAKQLQKLPKLLIVVHLAGQSCDMASIAKLSQQYGFAIIEDASHAIGGSYQSQPIGSCQYSDITVFSFHPVKIITTGEGGATLTNSSQLAEKLTLIRSHGITRDPKSMTKESEGDWYYQQVSLGYNYRMTDIQAALGNSQLTRLTEFVGKRNQLAQIYDNAFKNSDFKPLAQDNNCYSAYHLYVIQNIHWSKKEKLIAFNTLRDKGIQVHVHYIPIHLQPYYQALGFQAGDFPQAEQYYQASLTLPLHPEITSDEQQFIIQSVLSLIE